MSRKGYPSQVADQFVLRLPDGLRDQIKADAKANGRSMNAEIVARLEGSAKTLRDEIAIAALPAIIAATSAGQHHPQMREGDVVIASAIARDAYGMADAFMAARNGSAA